MSRSNDRIDENQEPPTVKGGDNGDKSLREIGRVIAAEIEKVFEAKVSPGTIKERARRMIGTNVPAQENQEPPTVKGGDNGDIVREVVASLPCLPWPWMPWPCTPWPWTPWPWTPWPWMSRSNDRIDEKQGAPMVKPVASCSIPALVCPGPGCPGPGCPGPGCPGPGCPGPGCPGPGCPGP